ncbi:MAG: hypothetical protein EOO77_24960 [Oxalobacteraceae bacterium]|nr:MAG: hypothetical protein EOO77_24960 [Oxalobacteraceae bacterium]
MNRDLNDWLLTCPTVRWISALAIEAAAAGLVDLRPEMAKAISGGVRMASLGETARVQPRDYYARSARMLAYRRRRCFLTLVADTLVLGGTIAPGLAISQSPKTAVAYIRRSIPETVVGALAGRMVDEVIHTPLMAFPRYSITNAEQDECGFGIWFDVPQLPFSQFV